MRKDLRIAKGIQIKLPYFFEYEDSPLAPLAKDLLHAIFHGRLRFSDNSSLPLSQHIFPLCLEQYVADQFQAFLVAQPLAKEGVYPLRSVSLEDAQALCPNLDLSVLQKNDFLFALERNQMGSHFAMAHVFEFLKSKKE